MSKEYGPIRRWLDKMGLMSIPPSEEQIPTAELPKADLSEMSEPEPEYLTKQELEISTADTRPLPPEMAEQSMAVEPPTYERGEVASIEEVKVEEPQGEEARPDEPKAEATELQAPAMDIKTTEPANMGTEMKERSSGPLLDLGYLEPSRVTAEEDFVLDLDLDEAPDPVESRSAFQGQQFERGGFAGSAVSTQAPMGVRTSDEVAVAYEPLQEKIQPTVDPMAQTQEMMQPVIASPLETKRERPFTEPQILEADTLRMSIPVMEPRTSGAISPDQLSPEMIDAIARRAVEMLSERAVQEIAWEVVPQLAELMIKRQLEEKSS